MTQGPHEPIGEPGSPRDPRSDSGPQLPQYGRMADPSQPAGQPSDPLQGASWQAGHPEARQARPAPSVPSVRQARRRGGAMTVTWVLIGINVAAFVLQMVAPALEPELVLWAPGVASGDWYRLITSAFLHYGIAHLLFNMLALYFVGPQLEMLLGRLRFGALYALSALGGSVDTNAKLRDHR
mgnify:CR=1 FL=1